MARPYDVYLGQTYTTETQPGNATHSGVVALTDWLEPLLMSQTQNGELGEAKFISSKPPEEARGLLALGQQIQIRNSSTDAVVFNGVIVKGHTVIKGDGVEYRVTAYNLGDYLLDRICLHGQFRRKYELESEFFSLPDISSPRASEDVDFMSIDAPLVFNPNGQPNATAQTFTFEAPDPGDHTFRAFEVPGRRQSSGSSSSSSGGEDLDIIAVPWTLRDAVAYLWNWYPITWAFDGSTTFLEMIDIDPVISNINLEGRSLGDGLRTLLEPYGYGYTVSTIAEDGKHALTIYRRSAGTKQKSLDLSSAGTNATDSTANLIALDLTEDISGVVNSIVSRGQPLDITTLLHTNPPSPVETQRRAIKLIPGWNPCDLEFVLEDGTTAFAGCSSSSSSSGGATVVNTFDVDFRKRYCTSDLINNFTLDGHDVRSYGIGRVWVANLGEVPNKALEDLTADLLGNNGLDPRKIEKPGIYTKNGSGGLLKQSDIAVEISTDAGAHWGVIEPHWYQVLDDSIGIVFIEPQLERLGILVGVDGATGVNYWQALKDSLLQIRVLCSVKSDERLAVTADNDGSVMPLARQRMYDSGSYRRSDVSIHVQDSLFWVRAEPYEDDQDDTEALQDITDRQLANTNRKIIHGTATVVFDSAVEAWTPGTEITAITNRFSFSTRPTVVRVVYDFPNQQIQLAIDNHTVKSVIRSNLRNVSRREQRLGIQASETLGTQSPYIPGARRSLREFYGLGGADGTSE